MDPVQVGRQVLFGRVLGQFDLQNAFQVGVIDLDAAHDLLLTDGEVEVAGFGLVGAGEGGQEEERQEEAEGTASGREGRGHTGNSEGGKLKIRKERKVGPLG